MRARALELTSANPADSRSKSAGGPGVPRNLPLLPEGEFQRMICLERKRAERSGKPFLLMLLNIGSLLAEGDHGQGQLAKSQLAKGKTATPKSARQLFGKITTALGLATRDTDVVGWYAEPAVIGILFTEIAIDLERSVLATLLRRVTGALRETLELEQAGKIHISFHLFPEEWNAAPPSDPTGSALYPDLRRSEGRKRWSRALKRIIDLAGAALALLLGAPLFLLIAVALKLSSPGPVLFRQARVGRYGRQFTFLKFRSMYVNNRADIHKEYVKQLIAGKARGEGGRFKIANDPRVTPLGKWLRRTSLDELPQFLNVLRGEMSLVGPRPPLPYEVEAYDVWHRRRLLEARPGITGLWQVNGRSRTKFDDMVRLDLQYARQQSLLLDLKILLRTPAAVFSGDGAY